MAVTMVLVLFPKKVVKPMNPTQEMVDVINKARVRNVPMEHRGLGSSLGPCKIFTKPMCELYYYVHKGACLVANGPFLEFTTHEGVLVQIVYTSVETISYPVEVTP